MLLIISLAALSETQSGSSGDNENDGKEHLKVVGKCVLCLHYSV